MIFTEERPHLLPYVTGGITDTWTDLVAAYAEAGADAVEVGLPFSDPTLDGPTIQEASYLALSRGTTADAILADVAGAPVPLVASTYYQLVAHAGVERFCARLHACGFRGLIVPDLPLEESAQLEAVAADAGIDLVLLASPATPAARLAEIARRSRGFVYAVSLMGTTGERHTLGAHAASLAGALTTQTDLPVLLGFGIATPEQAVEAARSADGIVVGAALMRRVLDGVQPAAVGAFVASLRRALDSGVAPDGEVPRDRR
jgi:tryptophan synthase alpha chain